VAFCKQAEYPTISNQLLLYMMEIKLFPNKQREIIFLSKLVSFLHFLNSQKINFPFDINNKICPRKNTTSNYLRFLFFENTLMLVES
jgi:hypothetical protein